MEVIKQLENIVKLQEELDKDTEVSYYKNNYSRFGSFISSVLNESPNKEENAKELVKHLDILWKYTDMYNNKWIYNDELLKQEDYIDNLIDTMDNFKFHDNIIIIVFGILYQQVLAYSKEKQDKLCQPKLYEKLLAMNLSEKSYESIMNKLSNDSQKQKDFINAILNSDRKIDFSRYTINKDNSYLITNNIDYLADVCTNLFGLKRRLSEKNYDVENLNVYMDLHFDKAIDSIIDYSNIIKTNNCNIRDIIKLVFKDIMENEEATFKDVNIVANGAFSLVVIVKDKVIKLSNIRANKDFPDNPYIVKPLLRKTLNDGDDSLFIEVTERVEPITHEDVKNNPDIIEEIYELYKNIRNLGLVWTDINYRNIGRLNKDNEIHWRDTIEPSSDVLEFTGKKGDTILKKGELVILDADHIYDENATDIDYPDSELKILFDKKYREELEKKDKKITIKGFTSLEILELILFNIVFASGIILSYIFMH